MTDFTLPELGENITTGDVLRVLVKEGDTIAKDQPVLELETDKATIEVPSSVAGQIKQLKVKAGETVKVGQAILSVEEDGAAKPETATPTPSKQEAAKPVESSKAEQPRSEESRPAAEARTSERPPESSREEEDLDKPPAAAGGATKVVAINRAARQTTEPAVAELPVAPAAPSVRRLARELGVDIDQVTGSGADGRISIDDVKAYAKRLLAGGADRGRTSGAAAYVEPLPDFTRFGEIDRQPMRAVRRKTAEHVSASWATVPHVTQHDLADVTALEELRKRYAKEVEAAGGSLTLTAIAVKVAAIALKQFPQFNASIDMASAEIIYKKYVNIGVAVDTDRGLLVPVIRDADTKGISQISIELAQLAEKARSRKLALDEMQGGTFSISNLGGLGGTAFTPIVNVPEVAILGISRARMEPVYDKSTTQFTPRLMLPLSLSYDHRAIDGADGVRFLRWIVESFEQTFRLLL